MIRSSDTDARAKIRMPQQASDETSVLPPPDGNGPVILPFPKAQSEPKAAIPEEGTPEAFQYSVREQLREKLLDRMQRELQEPMGIHDLSVFEARLDDRVLEAEGATTHEMKIRQMEQVGMNFFQKVSDEARALADSYEKSIEAALESGKIDKQTAEAFSELLASTAPWPIKRAYILLEFPAVSAKWNDIHESWNSAKEKADELNLAGMLPEIDGLFSEGFLSLAPDARQNIVDTAFAAMAAYETDRIALYEKAQRQLNEAVKKDILAPEKVGTWLRRIFESKADMKLIREFLSGEGKNPLSELMESWSDVTARFENVETQRLQGKKAPGFQFVARPTFLNWHYAARLAYISEAEERLNNEKLEGRDVLWDIRRELDMKDWDHAQWLIDQARRTTLEPKEMKEVESMQRYLTTQKVEDSTYKERQSESKDKSPHELLLEAMEELQAISPAACSIYLMAIKMGPKTVIGLNAIMYNRCWMKQNHIGVEEQKTEMKEEAKEETRHQLIYGDDGDHKKTSIPIGGGSGIRKFENGEWKSQIMFVNNDPGRQKDVLEACSSSNKTFRYWSSLFIDGVDYQQQSHVVFNVSWKIKKAMREGAGGTLEQLRSTVETQKKAA